jgi:NAD(P)-dependent dehydrogenase (short-subunit alcohol dehydrogenase family)
MIKTKKTLIIIAGATGEIGLEFIGKLSMKGDILAISQNRDICTDIDNLQHIKMDLTDFDDIQGKMSRIQIEKYKRVIFLHTIGVDSFDPRGYPKIKPMNTIPESVYNTNVNTFKYMYRYLLNRVVNINSERKDTISLRVGIIAGIGDKYTPFVIESFCEAKYILREYIRSAISLFPEFVSGISVNISSTITKSALKVRPYADTSFWLTPKEVAEGSYKDILRNKKGYYEIDIYKKSPKYFNGYYSDDEVLYKKWSIETGYSVE